MPSGRSTCQKMRLKFRIVLGPLFRKYHLLMWSGFMFKLLLQLSLFACWCCPSLISERIDKIPRSNADFPGFGRFIRISGLATKFLFSSLVFLFLSLASLPRISFVKVKFYYVAVPCWEFGCSGKLMWTVQLIQSPKLSCLFSSFFFVFFNIQREDTLPKLIELMRKSGSATAFPSSLS